MYRNLTGEQFGCIKKATAKVCKVNELKTIGEFKQIGNELIDCIENNTLSFADLLQEKIPYNPKKGVR